MPKLLYDPFVSAVDPSFWLNLTKYKLEVYKLSDAPIPIRLAYTTAFRSDAPCRTQATGEYSFVQSTRSKYVSPMHPELYPGVHIVLPPF